MFRLMLLEGGKETILEQVTPIRVLLGKHPPKGHVQDLPGVIVLEEIW